MHSARRNRRQMHLPRIILLLYVFIWPNLYRRNCFTNSTREYVRTEVGSKPEATLLKNTELLCTQIWMLPEPLPHGCFEDSTYNSSMMPWLVQNQEVNENLITLGYSNKQVVIQVLILSTCLWPKSK